MNWQERFLNVLIVLTGLVLIGVSGYFFFFGWQKMSRTGEGKPIASVIRAEGRPKLHPYYDYNWYGIDGDEYVYNFDYISTDDDASLLLNFFTGEELEIARNSLVVISSSLLESSFYLLDGAIEVRGKEGKRIRILSRNSARVFKPVRGRRLVANDQGIKTVTDSGIEEDPEDLEESKDTMLPLQYQLPSIIAPEPKVVEPEPESEPPPKPEPIKVAALQPKKLEVSQKPIEKIRYKKVEDIEIKTSKFEEYQQPIDISLAWKFSEPVKLEVYRDKSLSEYLPKESSFNLKIKEAKIVKWRLLSLGENKQKTNWNEININRFYLPKKVDVMSPAAQQTLIIEQKNLQLPIEWRPNNKDDDIRFEASFEKDFKTLILKKEIKAGSAKSFVVSLKTDKPNLYWRLQAYKGEFASPWTMGVVNMQSY